MEFDDYEMKEREQEQEQWEQERAREDVEAQEQAEQETNFDDIGDVVVDLKNLEDQQRQAEVDMDLGGSGSRGRDGIPNVRKDIAGIKRSITNDIKRVFKDI